MDRVLEARIAAARTRADELTVEEQGLLARLQDVRSRKSRALNEVEAVQHAAARTSGPGRQTATEEGWRDAVKRLRTFTVSELAAELGCSKPTAKNHLMEMVAREMVKPAGRLGKSPMYSYVKPDDAGAAFATQERLGLRVAEPVSPVRRYGGPVAGTGSHPADVISATAVRRVVKQAIAEGWQLVSKGDGHWNLVKDGCKKVGVAGTPTNPEGAAVSIARQLRNATRSVVAA